MSEMRRCPDCGQLNAADARSCTRCNFPLSGIPGALPTGTDAPDPADQGPAAPPEPAPAAGTAAQDVPIVLRRPRRRPPRTDPITLQLWLVFGTIAALVVVYVAVKANYDRAVQPVEGASERQQVVADSLERHIEHDSTDVAARVRLGDVLYDTGNWSDAIVQYRASIRMDSSRTTTLVDLGVCYYNLSHSEEAERLFNLALARDPHQAVALFNLGIVSERRKEWKAALGYYHRALQSDPPEGMKEPLVQHMRAVQNELGMTPPPLPDGK